MALSALHYRSRPESTTLSTIKALDWLHWLQYTKVVWRRRWCMGNVIQVGPLGLQKGDTRELSAWWQECAGSPSVPGVELERYNNMTLTSAILSPMSKVMMQKEFPYWPYGHSGLSRSWYLNYTAAVVLLRVIKLRGNDEKLISFHGEERGVAMEVVGKESRSYELLSRDGR